MLIDAIASHVFTPAHNPDASTGSPASVIDRIAWSRGAVGGVVSLQRP
jgi:hypothetical protein